jgi:hypothetical protein
MVRCKSIVEQTRVVVVDVMSRKPDENGGRSDDDDDDDENETEEDTEKEITEAETTDAEGNYSAAESTGFVDPNWEDPDDELYMDVARVYERTLVQLGEVMDEAVLP